MSDNTETFSEERLQKFPHADAELKTQYQQALDEEARLHKERQDLEDQLAPIKEQIVRAHGAYKRGIKNHTPSNFTELLVEGDRLRDQIKDINVKLQRHQRIMGEMRRRGQHLNTMAEKPRYDDKRKLFVEVAKEMLSPDLFNRIWGIVEGRVRMAEEAAQELSK